MTVLLVLLTFLLFAGLDYVLSRRGAVTAEAAPMPAVTASLGTAQPAADPVWIAGYELPANLFFHPGHTWARVTGPDTVTIGLDDFARRLTGTAGKVRLPVVGNWLRQGGRAFNVRRNGHSADLVSPVEGEVVEVNPALANDPSLATRDPYGQGWFCRVRTANLSANVRNLLTGSLARRWTEDAREQLELRLMALSGSVLQDGGEPAPDFADHLDADEWQRLVARFLLT